MLRTLSDKSLSQFACRMYINFFFIIYIFLLINKTVLRKNFYKQNQKFQGAILITAFTFFLFSHNSDQIMNKDIINKYKYLSHIQLIILFVIKNFISKKMYFIIKIMI